MGYKTLKVVPKYHTRAATPINMLCGINTMENEYLKVMILPELGGRIQRAYDKTNDYDFVYYNHVIKPALVGLAGPWISWCPCQGEDERRQLLIRLEKTLGTRKA